MALNKRQLRAHWIVWKKVWAKYQSAGYEPSEQTEARHETYGAAGCGARSVKDFNTIDFTLWLSWCDGMIKGDLPLTAAVAEARTYLAAAAKLSYPAEMRQKILQDRFGVDSESALESDPVQAKQYLMTITARANSPKR